VSESRTDVLKQNKRKGVAAGVAAAATVTLGLTFGAPVAVIAAVPTAILGLRWWKHRKENGIRI
jgi:phosphate/sulfate permease